MRGLVCNKYLVGELLSSTPHSLVYSGTQLCSGVSAILKTVPNTNTNSSIEEEYSLLKDLPPHPHLATFIERLETDSQVILVSVNAGCQNLFQYLNRFGSMNESDSISLMYSLILAVNHLHKHMIVHADIKPENIILDHKLSPVLCDFGGALHLSHKPLRAKCVSIPYSAPEVLDKEITNPTSLDIWSLGVVFHTIIIGQSPWSNEQWKKRDFKYDGHTSFSPLLRRILRNVLEKRVNKRWSMSQLINGIEGLKEYEAQATRLSSLSFGETSPKSLSRSSSEERSSPSSPVSMSLSSKFSSPLSCSSRLSSSEKLTYSSEQLPFVCRVSSEPTIKRSNSRMSLSSSVKRSKFFPLSIGKLSSSFN